MYFFKVIPEWNKEHFPTQICYFIVSRWDNDVLVAFKTQAG